MNEIREIVTKAVVGKGKKIIRLKETVNPKNEPFSVLGCWGINHEFEAIQIDDNKVELLGNFEINIWFAFDNNTRTDVVKKIVDYREIIKTKQLVKERISDPNDVIIRVIQQPTCTNARINDMVIEVDIVFEVVAEIIGETKMMVTVFSQAEPADSVDDDDFENEINEDFIET